MARLWVGDLGTFTYRLHLEEWWHTTARAKLRLVSGTRHRLIPPVDLREKPVYTLDEAARYVSIPPSTLATWALGRKKTETEEGYAPTLEHVNQRLRLLSFYDLVEAHILRAATEKRL